MKKIKKIKHLGLLSILAFSIFSCGNDADSDSGVQTNEIIGLWQIESIKIDGTMQDMDSCIALQTVEFDINNNTYSTFYDFDGSDCVLESIDSFTYVHSNNFLTVYGEEDTTISEVLELNATNLKVKTTINFDGMQIFEATYKKQ